MRPPRLTFYVMHLLGVGHIHRVRRLVECMVNRGILVDIIYGGTPTNIEFATSEIFCLPPISARDATYSEYVDSSGVPVTPDYLESRRRSLLDYFATLETDVLVTEMFPFGRRIVRDEILALLSEARSRPTPPLVISSVRDILENRRRVRHEESLQIIRDYFDYVLVHSDPGLIDFGATFPFTDEIESNLFYTGFVAPSSSSSPSSTGNSYDIIVSAGGGGFGYELLTATLQVSGREEWSSMRWCISMGSEMGLSNHESLTSMAPPHVTLVERLDDLTDYMRHARLSISQCGYNTAMDVLGAYSAGDCRAVFVPYDVSGQTEQLRRSELLSSSGFGVHLPHSDLTPDTLSESMSSSLSLPRPDISVDLDGCDRTTKIILDLLDSDTESGV